MAVSRKNGGLIAAVTSGDLTAAVAGVVVLVTDEEDDDVGGSVCTDVEVRVVSVVHTAGCKSNVDVIRVVVVGGSVPLRGALVVGVGFEVAVVVEGVLSLGATVKLVAETVDGCDGPPHACCHCWEIQLSVQRPMVLEAAEKTISSGARHVVPIETQHVDRRRQ